MINFMLFKHGLNMCVLSVAHFAFITSCVFNSGPHYELKQELQSNQPLKTQLLSVSLPFHYDG